MKYKDIHIKWTKGDPEKGEFWDKCSASALFMVNRLCDKEALMRHYVQFEDEVETEVRREIYNELYGEMNKLAMDALNEAMRIAPYYYEHERAAESLRAKLSKLIHYGQHLYKKPTSSSGGNAG